MAKVTELRVNGKRLAVEAEAETLLLTVLRDHLDFDRHQIRLRRRPVLLLHVGHDHDGGRAPAHSSPSERGGDCALHGRQHVPLRNVSADCGGGSTCRGTALCASRRERHPSAVRTANRRAHHPEREPTARRPAEGTLPRGAHKRRTAERQMEKKLGLYLACDGLQPSGTLLPRVGKEEL
jgi:hypothetical protein